MAGRSHLRSQTPCQDAFAIEATDSGFVAVLCDGAGSAVHSELGAREVSRAVCCFLAENSEQDLDPQRIIACALEPIKALATAMEAEPRDFACTLVAVKVIGDCAFLYHLGDGAIIASRAGEARVASRPSRGEFANSTVFVTSADAVAALRIRTIPLDPTTRTIVLTTDGLQDLFLDNATGEASQVCEQMATWHDADLPQVVADKLDASLRDFFLPRTHDDCSMVVARRMTPADEVLPPVCPGCARWVVTARRAGAGFRFRCHGCGCEFTSRSFHRGEAEGNLGRPNRQLAAADGLAAVCFLSEMGPGADRFSSWWTARLASIRPQKTSDPLSSKGALAEAVESSLLGWRGRLLEDPPVLLIGSIKLGRARAGGRLLVTIAIREDGKREVVGFADPGGGGGMEAFLGSIKKRGAGSTRLIVCQQKLGIESVAQAVWPQAEILAGGRGKAIQRLKGSGRPAVPNRLRSLAAVGSLEREVRALLKAATPSAEMGVQVIVEAAMAQISERWVSGKAYISLEQLIKIPSLGCHGPETGRISIRS